MDAVAVAREAIDAANADDPTDHDGEPLARAQGRLADHWARRLDPDASDALRLAARAHHLRRWVVPRPSYPDHMVEVIAKTLGKMSAQGRAAAAGIPIDAAGAALVGRAVEHFAAG